MFILALLWLLVGILCGLLAGIARLHISLGWVRLLAIGAGMGICGGWVGLSLLGSPFSVATALWISILGILVIPWCWQSLEKRLHV